jgi:aspartyl-tRNA(Asn)/glutamyl-tRNA(Gln) amidotransferase subunit A
MTDLADLPATDMLAAYRDGTLSPVAVIDAVLEGIEASEPKLHAMWTIDAEPARAAARASEARWQRGAPVGALDGVPITIKENIATKGVPVPLGTAATELVPAAADAPPAARVREAGAIILGKTTMPDYGMLSSAVSSFHALSRNPWDLTRNPGGSSSGAGAAGASGYGPLHIGTDIGGSVRLPAGWCGLVGLKPSNGRIPIDPPYYGRVAGPMTRTVADAALLMSVLCAPDWRDHMSLPASTIAWDSLEIDPHGLRIGLMLDIGTGIPAERDVAEAVRAAAARFAAAGAIVEPLGPFFTREMLDGLDKFWRTRSWSDMSRLAPDRLAKVLPYIRDWAEKGEHLSGLEVYRGFSQSVEIRAAAVKATQPYDFVLSPVAPMPAFPAELPGPTNDPERPFEHICFTVPFNMSEQPAVSVNCGYSSEGLPIGLQIIGRRFDDIGVLRMARLWETLRDKQHPWPRVWED